MLYSESDARKRWCPFVRVENANRIHNTRTDGFEGADQVYHCLGSRCMCWRDLQLSHMKGSSVPGTAEKHGFCGLAGRPDLEQGW